MKKSCPVNQGPCQKTSCQWWIDEEEFSDCTLPKMAQHLQFIASMMLNEEEEE
jgi:hypothetical protein